jgi:hypothetical protein
MNVPFIALRPLSLVALIAAVLFGAPSTGHSAEWNGIRLSPQAGVSETYDDNITFSSDNEEEDFITSIEAGLKAVYETQLTSATMLGMLRYDIFASNGQYDNLSGSVDLDWKQELTQYDRIRVRDHYLHAEEPTTYAEAFNRSTGRLSFQRNQVWLDYEHDFTPQWAGTARYSNEMTVFSEDILADSSMNSVGAGLIYHLTSRTDLLADYDYVTRDYDGASDAFAHRVSGGVKHHFTEWMYFEGRAGADFIESYNGEEMTEPRVSGKLTVEVDPTMRIEAMAEQEHALNSYTQDVFDHWQATATLLKEWNERMRTGISGFYGEGEYVTLRTEDTFVGAGVWLGYDLTPNLEAKAKYEFTDVDSTDRDQQYTKNVFLIALTLRF